jgi:adenine-specific DNA glycosylase
MFWNVYPSFPLAPLAAMICTRSSRLCFITPDCHMRRTQAQTAEQRAAASARDEAAARTTAQAAELSSAALRVKDLEARLAAQAKEMAMLREEREQQGRILLPPGMEEDFVDVRDASSSSTLPDGGGGAAVR